MVGRGPVELAHEAHLVGASVTLASRNGCAHLYPVIKRDVATGPELGGVVGKGGLKR